MQQPQNSARINPAFDGPTSVLWTGSGTTANWARSGQGTIYNNSLYNGNGFAARSDGVVLLPDTGNNRSIYFPVSTNAPSFTVLVYCKLLDIVNGGGGIMQYADVVKSSAPRMLLKRTGYDLQVYFNSSYLLTDTNGANTILGKFAPILVRYDGSVIHYYRKGVHLSTSSSAANSASNIWFGNGYLYSDNLELLLGYWVGRDIGDTACTQLVANPWQLFAP